MFKVTPLLPNFQRCKIVLLLLLSFLAHSAPASNKEQLTEMARRASEMRDKSPEQAVTLLKSVLEETEPDKYPEIRALALKTMGLAQSQLKNYRQSMEYYELALSLYRELDDLDGIASILNNMGVLFERKGELDKALKKYSEASDLFSKNEDSKAKLTIALSNMGIIYYNLGRMDLALDYLSQALKNSEALKDSAGIAPSLNNIGNIYLSLKDYKTALTFYERAAAINKILLNTYDLTAVYNNIGDVKLNMGNIKEALHYNQLSLELATKNEDSDGMISSLLNMGKIFIKIKEYQQASDNFTEALRISNLNFNKFLHASVLAELGELAVIQNDADKAIYHYREALSLIEKSGFEMLNEAIYAGLAEAWSIKGNYNKAYEYLQKKSTLADSMYNKENMNRLNNLRAGFELEQAEKANQMLKQQNIYNEDALTRQRTIRNLLIAIVSIVIMFLSFVVYQYISKKKKNDLLAESNEKILKQKAELDKLYLEQYKLNETKNRFFSIIAHDLKSPFQSLLGFSELLNTEYENFSDLQRKDAINNVYKVTGDTYKLIENLLEWGRIQTGNANPIMKVFYVKDLVDSVLPIYEPQLKNKKLTVSIEIPALLMAHADQHMMSATLRNLISNAIKFSYEGSTLYIKGSLSNNQVKLAVSDSGMGIAPELINKLFSFNAKIRKTGTQGETGTGMGLGLCMELMQLNNGTIMVSSKKGEGSTFTMVMQPAALSNVPLEHSAKAQES